MGLGELQLGADAVTSQVMISAMVDSRGKHFEGLGGLKNMAAQGWGIRLAFELIVLLLGINQCTIWMVFSVAR